MRHIVWPCGRHDGFFAGLLLLLAAGCGSQSSTSTAGTTPDEPATSVARLPADTLTFRPVMVTCVVADGATCANDPTLEDLPSADPAAPDAAYVVGPVLADVAVMPALVRMHDLGIADWQDLPRVVAWFDNIRAQPAFKPTYYQGSLLSERFPHLREKPPA